MSEEIFLKRPHAGVPWGFRIIGGSDSHLPIIVSKVLEGSIAQGAGLEEDILLERINNIPTSGLTHSEVDQVILSAENELLFTVRREKLENLILASLSDFEDDSEITNILRQAVNQNKIVEEEEKKNVVDEFEDINVQREFGEIMVMENSELTKDNQLEQNLYGKPSMERALTERKWSTFLQKPKNPPPKTQAMLPKTNQYRVIIKKQKKKEDIKKADATHEQTIKEQKIEEPEISQEIQELETEQISSVPECEKMSEENIYEAEVRLECSVIENESNLEEKEVQECDLETVAVEENETNENSDLHSEKDKEEITEMVEHIPTLEEQLAAVQAQLRQLAQLPSSVQESLSMVTEQLANIVGVNKPQTEENEEENDVGDSKEEPDQNAEYQTNLDEDENDLRAIKAIEDSEYEDRDEMTENAEIENSNSEALSDILEEQELSEAVDENENVIGTEDDAEQRRIEEEKLMKQQLEQKMIEEEEEKKKPIVRPIILPGGRKWVDPDDAVIKVKNPKMTDDKICDTINTFSEVIVGKTKGINFLKYTPPPKNLDYLQKSDVYRLIHGMEPPVKGISLRSEMIMAEEDYYSGGEA